MIPNWKPSSSSSTTVDWDKQYLCSIWEEYSLSAASLDSEVTSLPSLSTTSSETSLMADVVHQSQTYHSGDSVAVDDDHGRLAKPRTGDWSASGSKALQQLTTASGIDPPRYSETTVTPNLNYLTNKSQKGREKCHCTTFHHQIMPNRQLHDVRCQVEIGKLQNELLESKGKILAYSKRMADQSSQLDKLLQERSAYLRQESGPPKESRSYRAPYPVSCTHYDPIESLVGAFSQSTYFDFCGRMPPAGYPEERLRGQTVNQDQKVLESLKEQIQNLQMRNLELTFFLKKEEGKRKDAEEANRRDQNYIKTLEENVQALNTSRVIMDPLAYKEVADSYMASRKKPVRRSRTCTPYSLGHADLVCDSQNSHFEVKSCPSSPLGKKVVSSSTQNGSSSSQSPTREMILSNHGDNDGRQEPISSLSDNGFPYSLQQRVQNSKLSSNKHADEPVKGLTTRDYQDFLGRIGKVNLASPS